MAWCLRQTTDGDAYAGRSSGIVSWWLSSFADTQCQIWQGSHLLSTQIWRKVIDSCLQIESHSVSTLCRLICMTCKCSFQFSIHPFCSILALETWQRITWRRVAGNWFTLGQTLGKPRCGLSALEKACLTHVCCLQLTGGVLVTVRSSLVPRQRQHFAAIGKTGQSCWHFDQSLESSMQLTFGTQINFSAHNSQPR